jgi:hypothetical protein
MTATSKTVGRIKADARREARKDIFPLPSEMCALQLLVDLAQQLCPEFLRREAEDVVHEFLAVRSRALLEHWTLLAEVDRRVLKTVGGKHSIEGALL